MNSNQTEYRSYLYQVCLSLSFLRLLDMVLYLFLRVSVFETTRQIRFPFFIRRGEIATRSKIPYYFPRLGKIASRIFSLSSFLIVPKESLIIRIESHSR